MASKKISKVGWFLSTPAKTSNLDVIHRVGCRFLILGVLLLPFQVGQGAFLSRYHLQWADLFLGIALVMGALMDRAQIFRLARIWGAFWLAAFLCALNNGSPYVFVRWLGLIYVTSMIALIPMYFSILRRQGFGLFCLMALLALSAAMLDGILQYFSLTTPYYGQNAPLLLKGSFMHPNALAHFLAITGFLFIYYIPSPKRVWILSGCALTMVFTISRSIIAIPLWLLAIVRRRLTKGVFVCMILLILATSIFFTYYAVGPELDLIVSFRWKGLQAGMWTWLNHIWLGLGPGTWPIVPEYATMDSPGRPGDAMNTYVNLLSTTGLIGFFAYFFGWVRIFQLGKGTKRPAYRKLWFALMGYYALTNLFISSEDFRHLYLLTGWLLCLVTHDAPEQQPAPL
jgi:hypothetical protein